MKPTPKPERCAHCGLPVARWRVVRGKLVFCTFYCSRAAMAITKGLTR